MMPLAPLLVDLTTISLFDGLPEPELERVKRLLRTTTVASGTTIMSSDQPGSGAYIILRGTLKVSVEQPSGANVILAILGPGEVIGELSLFDSGTSPATAVTMEETTALWLERGAFQECLEQIPRLATNLITILVRRLRLANAQIQSLATQDVYGRVARQLVTLAEIHGQSVGDGVQIPLRLTQSDLAETIGASRVRVNRVLVAFKERRHISVEQHCITIHQPEALAEYIA